MGKRTVLIPEVATGKKFTVAECAKMFGKSPITIYGWIAEFECDTVEKLAERKKEILTSKCGVVPETHETYLGALTMQQAAEIARVKTPKAIKDRMRLHGVGSPAIFFPPRLENQELFAKFCKEFGVDTSKKQVVHTRHMDKPRKTAMAAPSTDGDRSPGWWERKNIKIAGVVGGIGDDRCIM
ncbi:MAG: hypothetical protein KJ630_19220 [Proteobacteria bacterium]|nr:hypothetical protein [Pseudomonadota bacterium]